MKSVILSLLVTCATIAAAAQTAPAPTPAMVHDEIATLEFIGGGSPLTPQERQLAAGIVAMGMHAHSDLWIAADNMSQQVLARVAKHNPADTFELRELNRYIYAFTQPDMTKLGAEFVLEKRIIDTHDPVIVLDAAHKRLITQHSLESLRSASAWTATFYGIPGPGPSFNTVVVKDLKEQLNTIDPNIADGIAHIERNAIYAPTYFNNMSAEQKNSAFLSKKDKVFNNLQDPASEQWQIAEAAGMLTRFAANQAQKAMVHSTTSAMLRSQQRQLNYLHNAGVAGAPACNTATVSYEQRYANGCIK